MPPWLRRTPFDVTHPARESEQPRGPLAVRTHEMSHFCAQFEPKVNEASATGRAVLPSRAATDTRSPVSTHLMSKASRGTLACSFITPIKIACAFVPWSLNWVQQFFEDDFGTNQLWKIDYQKRFPVIQMNYMYSEADVCRGSAGNENLELSQVDWKRETIFHCNLIPHLENLLNDS